MTQFLDFYFIILYLFCGYPNLISVHVQKNEKGMEIEYGEKSEEKFPETAVSWGQPIICIKTTERYPFTETDDPGYGFGYLEGDFLDEYTFAGIYRIDIRDVTQADQEKKDMLLAADSLNIDFTINQIIGDRAEPEKPDYQGKTKEELEAMTDEEWDAFMKEVYSGDWSAFPNTHENWWFDGPFEFELSLAVDKKMRRLLRSMKGMKWEQDYTAYLRPCSRLR